MLGSLMYLVLESQPELWDYDIPIRNLRIGTSTEELDLSRDRGKKPYVEFETEFQYNLYSPIQRYLRDIKVSYFDYLEVPSRVFLGKIDGF